MLIVQKSQQPGKSGLSQPFTIGLDVLSRHLSCKLKTPFFIPSRGGYQRVPEGTIARVFANSWLFHFTCRAGMGSIQGSSMQNQHPDNAEVKDSGENDNFVQGHYAGMIQLAPRAPSNAIDLLSDLPDPSASIPHWQRDIPPISHQQACQPVTGSQGNTWRDLYWVPKSLSGEGRTANFDPVYDNQGLVSSSNRRYGTSPSKHLLALNQLQRYDRSNNSRSQADQNSNHRTIDTIASASSGPSNNIDISWNGRAMSLTRLTGFNNAPTNDDEGRLTDINGWQLPTCPQCGKIIIHMALNHPSIDQPGRVIPKADTSTHIKPEISLGLCLCGMDATELDIKDQHDKEYIDMPTDKDDDKRE
ncbi:hypothetical protein CPC08DRAFT_785154 [Agrocybe pediades]|nr:hypothetical protein CPC08DRAFT_785154 [Agrocybe pediades]